MPVAATPAVATKSFADIVSAKPAVPVAATPDVATKSFADIVSAKPAVAGGQKPPPTSSQVDRKLSAFAKDGSAVSQFSDRAAHAQLKKKDMAVQLQQRQNADARAKLEADQRKFQADKTAFDLALKSLDEEKAAVRAKEVSLEEERMGLLQELDALREQRNEASIYAEKEIKGRLETLEVLQNEAAKEAERHRQETALLAAQRAALDLKQKEIDERENAFLNAVAQKEEELRKKEAARMAVLDARCQELNQREAKMNEETIGVIGGQETKKKRRMVFKEFTGDTQRGQGVDTATDEAGVTNNAGNAMAAISSTEIAAANPMDDPKDIDFGPLPEMADDSSIVDTIDN